MFNITRKILYYGCEKNYRIKYLRKLYSQNIKEKEREKGMSFFSNSSNRIRNSIENFLSKNFPQVLEFVKACVAGTVPFKNDIQLLVRVMKKVHLGPGINDLSRKELEIYYQAPSDLAKAGPVVIFTALPFGVLFLPLVYQFPRLLSHHFWSENQKIKFAESDYRKKFNACKSVYFTLQSQLVLIQSDTLKKHFTSILENLECGIHPSVEKIMECKALFEEQPFSLQSLENFHLRSLLRVHNLHICWRWKERLARHAALIQAMDQALYREGGPDRLSLDELKWASSFRGLNPINLTKGDMICWLEKWMLISRMTDKNSYSLILHCPVLLAYKHLKDTSLLDSTGK